MTESSTRRFGIAGIAVCMLGFGLAGSVVYAATTLSSDIDTDGNLTVDGLATLGDSAADVLTFNGTLAGASPLLFEGATANDFETTFAITDPTADNTITFPNATGTVLLSGGAGSFTTLSSTGVTTIGNGSATVAIDSSDWDITSAGVMTGIGAITADGTLTISGVATDITTGTNENLTLNPNGAGNLVVSGLDCTGNANGGALTAAADGTISCTDDDTAGGVGADSLDFDEFEDAMDLDAATSVALAGFAYTIDLTGTGDFVIADAGTPFVTFADDSTVTIANAATVNGTLDANGTVTLGDAGDTITLDSSDWDITATGVMTGIGAITADGTLTLSGVATDITTGTDEDLTLNPNGTGNLVVAGLDCTGNANGGALTAAADGTISCSDDNTGGGGANSFETWDTPAGTDPVADNATDTITFLAGTNVTVTGSAGADSITFDLVDAFLFNTGDTATGTYDFTGAILAGASPFVFEGATANDFETTFAITDPTADNTITFPNSSLTVNAAADISGTTLASNVVTSSLTTVGALDAGSITSGFGAIDIGTDNITTTGTVSMGIYRCNSVQAVTIADNGLPTRATQSVDFQKSCIEITCNDLVGGCSITAQETSAVSGMVTTITNISATNTIIPDVLNVLNGDAFSTNTGISQDDSVTYRYTVNKANNLWVQIAASANN